VVGEDGKRRRYGKIGREGGRGRWEEKVVGEDGKRWW
jgi:hypothetical protein